MHNKSINVASRLDLPSVGPLLRRYDFLQLMKKILILLLCTSYCLAGELPDSFEEAKKLALSMESVEELNEHQSSVQIPYFGQKYSNVLKSCFSNIENPDQSSFEFVIALDESGGVQRVYRDRDTNISSCMFAELEADIFPRPIKSPFYIHIEMGFTE